MIMLGGEVEVVTDPCLNKGKMSYIQLAVYVYSYIYWCNVMISGYKRPKGTNRRDVYEGMYI